MNQWLATVDVPECGTVFNKHPEEFLYAGYSAAEAAKFRNTGYNQRVWRTADEYKRDGEFAGYNAGLFSATVSPNLVPLGYKPPARFIVGPRGPRVARFSIQTE